MTFKTKECEAAFEKLIEESTFTGELTNSRGWYKLFFQSGWDAALESQWQPIESVPKNGSRVLLARYVDSEASWIDEGWWYFDDEKEFLYDRGENYEIEGFDATHWMPQLAPPKKAGV